MAWPGIDKSRNTRVYYFISKEIIRTDQKHHIYFRLKGSTVKDLGYGRLTASMIAE